MNIGSVLGRSCPKEAAYPCVECALAHSEASTPLSLAYSVSSEEGTQQDNGKPEGRITQLSPLSPRPASPKAETS
jgi:hypothetical protein